MAKAYNLAPKLKLVLDHLRAVRTIDEYLDSDVGMKKDTSDLFNHVTKELYGTVLKRAGWERFRRNQGNLFAFPADGKWRVRGGDQIGIEICPVPPLGDDYDTDPSVNLYVPPKWKALKEFTEYLIRKAPEGFDNIKKHEGEDYYEENPIFKYVRYAESTSDGHFNETKFLEAFKHATAALVGMSGAIDAILDRIQKRS
jgi:hypothetical protein